MRVLAFQAVLAEPPPFFEPLEKPVVRTIAIAEVPAYAGLPDELVLELAAAEGRVLVTRNAKDFGRITRA